jgi:hypothetical protein
MRVAAVYGLLLIAVAVLFYLIGLHDAGAFV